MSKIAVRRRAAAARAAGRPVRSLRVDIPPYAGRKVAELRETYAHHAGQCQDHGERIATLREGRAAGHVRVGVHPHRAGQHRAEICSIAGTKPTAYLEHMKREHGATQLHPTVAPIRLRKGVPAAARQAPRVAPFKRIEWAERHYAEWQPGTGNERLPDTQHRGSSGLTVTSRIP